MMLPFRKKTGKWNAKMRHKKTNPGSNASGPVSFGNYRLVETTVPPLSVTMPQSSFSFFSSPLTSS